MIVEALVTALVIAAGCNLFMFAAWWRAALQREIYREERSRAIKKARDGLAAMEVAITAAANVPLGHQ
jgi:hypothetical protein